MIRMPTPLQTTVGWIGWGLVVVTVALVLAGCAGAPEEEGAERAVARESGSERVECTGRSRIWFREGPPAEVLLCIARREEGRCDRYRVERRRAQYRVRLIARGDHCSLPPG
jgi:hypothetical protein